MKPIDDNLEESFGQLHISTSERLDRSIYREIAVASEKARATRLGSSVPSLLYAIVTARATKLAAAVIIVAAIIGLHQFNNAIKGTSIVWADVAERLANVHSYKARARRILTEVGRAEPFYQCDIVRYFRPEHGSMEASYVDGELTMLAYCWLSEHSAVIVLPLSKQYCRFDLNQELLSVVEYLNPADTAGMMTLFGSERCTPLGPKEIEGVTAEGFEVRDVKLFAQVPRLFLEVKRVDIRLWVDEETLLPVRFEADGLIGKSLMTGFKEFRYQEVMHDIEYDLEIDDSIFDLSIPDDYTSIDPADMAEKAELLLLGVLLLGGMVVAGKRHLKSK